MKIQMNSLILVVLSAGVSGAEFVRYDVQDLSAGSLLSPNQDNWEIQGTFTGPLNTDLVVQHHLIPGAKFLVGSSIDGVRATRQNDANLSYPMIPQEFESYRSFMDVQIRDSIGDYWVFFGNAGDSIDAGDEPDSIFEVGPQFGVRKMTSGSGAIELCLRQAGYGALTAVPLGTLAGEGEWLRLCMDVSITNATFSLSVRNRSRGESLYTPVQALQDLPAGFTNLLAGAGPYQFDTMHLDVKTELASPLTRSFAFDNLVPNLTGVVPHSLDNFSIHRIENTELYTFELTEVGSLVSPSQESWKLDPAFSKPADIRVVQGDSKFIRGSSAVGTATYRFGDDRFRYAAVEPLEELTSFVDVQVRDVDAGVNAIFHHAADSDADGVIHFSETGPGFGIFKNVDNLGKPLSFVYRGAAYSPSLIYSDIGSFASDQDWLRLRLVMNFDTGLARLSFRNLTRGQTAYSDVVGMQALPLELNRLPGNAQPQFWNALHLRFDTLSFGEPGNSFGMGMDNLVPNSNIHPLESFVLPSEDQIALTADYLLEGETYSIFYREQVDGSTSFVRSFVANRSTHQAVVPATGNQGYYEIVPAQD